MEIIPDLTPFASLCLEEFGNRYPQFTGYIKPSIFDDHEWSMEVPWPDGWESIGLRVGIRVTPYGEVFRVDLGNWDIEYLQREFINSEKLLLNAFKLIDEILAEKIVLIAKWISTGEYIGKWSDHSYLPYEDKELYGAKEIWMKSWRGTYNKVWNLNN
jgi:hypothetical protein